MRRNTPAILLLMIVPLKCRDGYNRDSKGKIHFFVHHLKEKYMKYSQEWLGGQKTMRHWIVLRMQ
ncbi:hypothetical protein Ruko_11510 [Ruthenibacterium sp. TH_2024_36131]